MPSESSLRRTEGSSFGTRPPPAAGLAISRIEVTAFYLDGCGGRIGAARLAEPLEQRSRPRVGPGWVDSFDAFRPLVAGVVDSTTDGLAEQLIVRAALQKGDCLRGWNSRLKPGLLVRAADDEGHAAVNWRDNCVGGGCQDCAAVNGFNIRLRLPTGPQPSEGEQWRVRQMKPPWPFRPLGLWLPFEEAIGGNQAAVLLQEAAISRFFRDRFNPRVDHLVLTLA